MSQEWKTEEDILKDFAAVNAPVSIIDKDYVVQGLQPPPIRKEAEEDEEIQMRLFGCTLKNQYDSKIYDPDLSGITEMIRIVQEDNNLPTYEDNKLTDPTLIITKLHPNTDFIPKHNENIDSVTEPPTSSLSQDINLNNNSLTEQTDLLKEKIKDLSESNSQRHKKEKNIAMSSLLKLYAKNNPSSSSSPKLLPPLHYASSLPSVQLISSDNTQNNSASCGTLITDHTDQEKPASSLNKKELNVQLNEPSSSHVNDDNSYEIDETLVHQSVELKEVEKSVKKVKAWLEPKTKPKGPIFGPITFKKKHNSEPQTKDPASNNSTAVQKKPVISNYVPSKHAQDLCKKFTEQKKATDIIREDMFSKLERELKERDEIIKSKALMSSESN